MSQSAKVQIIYALSQSIPQLADAVNNLISYVQNSEETDHEVFINKLFNVSVSITRTLQNDINLDQLNIKTEELPEIKKLLEEYYLSLRQINRGCKLLLAYIIKEKDLTTKNSHLILKEFEPEEITIEAGVECLYQGTKLIFSVIDEATEE
jgi:hypothetical protein